VDGSPVHAAIPDGSDVVHWYGAVNDHRVESFRPGA
jgi:hypothetical protein